MVIGAFKALPPRWRRVTPPLFDQEAADLNRMDEWPWVYQVQVDDGGWSDATPEQIALIEESIRHPHRFGLFRGGRL